MPGIQQPTKTPISESKIAVFWRTALYLFSAGMMGKAAAGFSDGYVAEAVGDLGLSLVFIGMCFRSTELAILAYISDPAKKGSCYRKAETERTCETPVDQPFNECRLDLFIGRSRRPIVKYLLIM